MKSEKIILLYILCFTCLSVSVQAATLVVKDAGTTYVDVLCEEATYTSINAAIDDSMSRDEILVCSGTYNETVDFKGHRVTLRSKDGAASTIIDADTDKDGVGDGSVVTFKSREGIGSVLDGFTLTNGTGFDVGELSECPNGFVLTPHTRGGGIYCLNSSPKIKNCIVKANKANDGGGIYLDNSSPSIVNCVIGGPLDADGNKSIPYSSADERDDVILQRLSDAGCDSQINAIAYGGEGGGVYVWYSSSMRMTNCTVSHNTSINGGAGIYLYSSSPSITDSTFSDNVSLWGGGGIHCDNASPIITNCKIIDNTARDDGTQVNVGANPISNPGGMRGGGTGKGGGILCWASSFPAITDCEISGNLATWGGGIHCDESSPTITSCTINNNTAEHPGRKDGVTNAVSRVYAYGGGIFSYRSEPIITKCTISGNYASENGGGIYSENYIDYAQLKHLLPPGGINDAYKSPIITKCIISNNTANEKGGGIACEFGSSPVITSCLIINNSASYWGGAIHAGEYFEPCDINDTLPPGEPCWKPPSLYNTEPYISKPLITHCTIVGNEASDGGAIFAENNSHPVVRNSIMWDNESNEVTLSSAVVGRRHDTRSDVMGGVIEITYSDIEGGYAGTGNKDVYPEFDNAAAGDYRLLPSSPLLDKGETLPSVTEDIEGTPYPQGSGYDMGAYELCVSPETFYQDNDNDSFGNPSVTKQGCVAPRGYVSVAGDCDDDDASINPKTRWYPDSDKDGFGDKDGQYIESCTKPAGDYVLDNTDCDDADVKINPETRWYLDGDGDGYGDPSVAFKESCTQPAGYVSNDADCDDSDENLNPDTRWYPDEDEDGYGDVNGQYVESCLKPAGKYVMDNTDCDDSDPVVNPKTPWYLDSDGDGYGDPNVAFKESCTQPVGYVANQTDCDDLDSGVYPGAQEICNGIDDNCDGLPEGAYAAPLKITDNLKHDTAPQINGSRKIVWSGEMPGGIVEEILMYDASDGTTTNISGIVGGSNAFAPQINEAGSVVWEATSTRGKEIYLYDGSATNTWLSKDVVPNVDEFDFKVANGYLFMTASKPQISDNGDVGWGLMVDDDGDEFNEICFYDGTLPTTTLTDTRSNRFPAINGGSLVWYGTASGGNDIFLRDASGISNVSSRTYDDVYPHVSSNGFIAWRGRVGGFLADYEIFLYDGTTTTQVTSNNFDDAGPKVNAGGNVVWAGKDSGGDYEIFLYTGALPVVQITDNSYDDINPRINENGEMTWQANIPNASPSDPADYEIFTYDITKTLLPNQITDNLYNDENPEINTKGDVVWRGRPVNTNSANFPDDEIFFSEHDFCIQEVKYYLDDDKDGFGTRDSYIMSASLSPPYGYSDNDTDCDDNDFELNPDTLWYEDADNDGYSTGKTVKSCLKPASWYILASSRRSPVIDVDDKNPVIHPRTPWYKDDDNDGYSDGTKKVQSTRPLGYKLSSELVEIDTDCDDSNENINPNTVWYRDEDGDGYSSGVTKIQCLRETYYKLASEIKGIEIDCDDKDASINPKGAEVCSDGIDQDCNGVDLICTGYPKISIKNGSYVDGRFVFLSGNPSFTATVTGESKIKKVTFYYRPVDSNSKKTSEYTSIAMVSSGDNKWEALVPILSGGVEYYIVAEDENGHSSRSLPPVAGSVPTLSEWGTALLLTLFLVLFYKRTKHKQVLARIRKGKYS